MAAVAAGCPGGGSGVRWRAALDRDAECLGESEELQKQEECSEDDGDLEYHGLFFDLAMEGLRREGDVGLVAMFVARIREERSSNVYVDSRPATAELEVIGLELRSELSL